MVHLLPNNKFRTSCRCFHCKDKEGKCETFRTIINPRPWKRDTTRICHGLVRCKTCKRLWNRDVNSSLNIEFIVKEYIRTKQRPLYLRRTTNQQH